jgi:hypothetical protein
MQDHPITLAALIAGAVITLIGVFMWAGAWAAMAAFGFIVFLFALAAAVAGWLLGEEIMRMEMMNVWILSQAKGSRRCARGVSHSLKHLNRLAKPLPQARSTGLRGVGQQRSPVDKRSKESQR